MLTRKLPMIYVLLIGLLAAAAGLTFANYPTAPVAQLRVEGFAGTTVADSSIQQIQALSVQSAICPRPAYRGCFDMQDITGANSNLRFRRGEWSGK